MLPLQKIFILKKAQITPQIHISHLKYIHK